MIGALPLREGARRHPAMQRAMLRVNAAMGGPLRAAFDRPAWTSAIKSLQDFGLAVALLMPTFWKVPPPAVVVFCAVAAGVGWH